MVEGQTLLCFKGAPHLRAVMPSVRKGGLGAAEQGGGLPRAPDVPEGAHPMLMRRGQRRQPQHHQPLFVFLIERIR